MSFCFSTAHVILLEVEQFSLTLNDAHGHFKEVRSFVNLVAEVHPQEGFFRDDFMPSVAFAVAIDGSVFTISELSLAFSMTFVAVTEIIGEAVIAALNGTRDLGVDTSTLGWEDLRGFVRESGTFLGHPR